MERESGKHRPRLDDELAGEAESLLRGSPVESPVEKGREKEGPGDEDREARQITFEAGARLRSPAENVPASRLENSDGLRIGVRLGGEWGFP